MNKGDADARKQILSVLKRSGPMGSGAIAIELKSYYRGALGSRRIASYLLAMVAEGEVRIVGQSGTAHIYEVVE